jgi:uncharacterized protein YndB with AHSA1/START domain
MVEDMPATGPQRSETRTISIATPPATVLDLVGDPLQLPRWAPAFAGAVRPAGDDWLVAGAAGEARVAVRVARAQGTVDIVAARRPSEGAFTRVIPNGDGSELIFTLCFPDGTAEPAIEQQMAVVEDELRAVRSLCEAAS